MSYWTDIIIRVNGSENDAKVISDIMHDNKYREKIKETADWYEKEILVDGYYQFGNSWSEKNETLSTFTLNQRFPFIYKDTVVRELKPNGAEYWFTGRIKDEFSLSYYLALHELLKEGDYDFNGKVTWYWLGEGINSLKYWTGEGVLSEQAEVGYCEITKEAIDFYFPYLEKGFLVEDKHIHLIQVPNYQNSHWGTFAEDFGINDRCKDILGDVNRFNIRHDEKACDTLIHEVQNYTLSSIETCGHECPELLFFAQLLMGPFTIITDSVVKAGKAKNGFYDYEDLIKAGWYTNTQGVPFFEFLKGITK